MRLNWSKILASAAGSLCTVDPPYGFLSCPLGKAVLVGAREPANQRSGSQMSVWGPTGHGLGMDSRFSSSTPARTNKQPCHGPLSMCWLQRATAPSSTMPRPSHERRFQTRITNHLPARPPSFIFINSYLREGLGSSLLPPRPIALCSISSHVAALVAAFPSPTIGTRLGGRA